MLSKLKEKYRSFVIAKRSKTVQKIVRERSSDSFKSQKHLIITGSPRSGTTWLGELMSDYTGKVMLFEPLSINECTKFKNIGFSWRQYIPENENWDEAKTLFQNVFNGEYLNYWMLSHSNIEDLNTADSFVIKFVRANLMLPWLINNFKLDYKPIHMVRHPLSVAASQLHLDWTSKSKLAPIKGNNYVKEYEQKYQDIVEEADTLVKNSVARWCMDNVYLLQHPDRDVKWVTIFYEDLFLNPEEEFRKLLLGVNLELDENQISLLDFEKVSTTAYREAPSIEEKKAQLSKWKSKLSTEQIVEGLEILRKFGISEYGEQITPLKNRN